MRTTAPSATDVRQSWFPHLGFFSFEYSIRSARGVNKKPPRMLSRRLLCYSRSATSLRGDVAGNDVTEQFPLLTLEALHLQLGDRGGVGGRGVDLDAGQQRVRRKVLQARRLLHDVGAGEVVAAHFQHLGE